VTPGIAFVEEARRLGGHRLWLRFNTGEQGPVDLGDLIAREPAAQALREPSEFAVFYLDAWPTIAWSCGFDVAPESLLARLRSGAQTAATCAPETLELQENRRSG
jgi:hypothetical protein